MHENVDRWTNLPLFHFNLLVVSAIPGVSTRLLVWPSSRAQVVILPVKCFSVLCYHLLILLKNRNKRKRNEKQRFFFRFFRRCWVTFDRSVNIKEVCWNLQNIRVRLHLFSNAIYVIRLCRISNVPLSLFQKFCPVSISADYFHTLRRFPSFHSWEIVSWLRESTGTWPGGCAMLTESLSTSRCFATTSN